jgi:alpha/beta superfamily hydrolase
MAPDFLREIAGPAGPLEALLDVPEESRAPVAVFGHPHPLHGGTMHTKALYQAAKAMPRIGVAALRFNFRGVGRSGGTFDSGPGEKEDFTAAIDFVSDRFPDFPCGRPGCRSDRGSP